FVFFNATPTSTIYTLSLHDALPILHCCGLLGGETASPSFVWRSSTEEFTMKRSILVVAVLVLSVSLFSTVGAERAGAQGPAGAGASSAAQGSSKSSDSKGGHSLN